VFNQAGHQIDVGGLLLVARESGEALGNPVKDSMLTKIGDSTRTVLAVVYGTSEALAVADMQDICARIARRLTAFSSATQTETFVLTGDPA